MPGAKAILAFVLRAVVVYALLLAAWPLVGGAYAAVYRGVGGVLFAHVGDGGRAQFEPLHPQQGPMDTRVVCTNRNAPGWQDNSMLISTRYKGYVPAVTLVALVLATPVTWKRRGWALLWGLPAVHVFVMARQMLSLVRKFSYESEIQAYVLSDWAAGVVQYVSTAMAASVFMCSFVVPAVVWVVVTVRWKRIANGELRLAK